MKTIMTTKLNLSRWGALASFLLASLLQASAWYSPSQQRWLNRDPINEEGFNVATPSGKVLDRNTERNLYEFVANTPENAYDTLGLVTEGEKCTSKPCEITNFKIQEDATLKKPKTGTLGAKANYDTKGDCQNISVYWWSCTGQAIWNKSQNLNSRDGTLPKHWYGPTNPYSQPGNLPGVAQATHARMEYLSCEGGVWTKRTLRASNSIKIFL